MFQSGSDRYGAGCRPEDPGLRQGADGEHHRSPGGLRVRVGGRRRDEKGTIAPPDDRSPTGGPGAPELSPAEIQAKVDKDRTSWNSHADRLREEAVKVLEIVKARDADRLFAAGTDLDRACENCHLDYWYPGDRAAVERDRNSRATFGNRGSK